MSDKITDNKTVRAAGLTLTQAFTINSDMEIPLDVLVPAGKTSTGFTHTTNTTGTITGPGSHGIVTGQLVDIYWTGGSRQRVIVGTVSGNAIPISGGTGDNLPASATVIQICARNAYNFNFIGDKLVALAAASPVAANVSFEDATPNLLYGRRLGAGEVAQWCNLSGAVNPLAGATPTQVFLTHGSTTAQDLTVVVGYMQ